MASHFAVVSYEKIIPTKEAAVTKNTKTATKRALIVLHGLIDQPSNVNF